MWDLFGKHHYLTSDFNPSCRLFLIYWDEILIGMYAILPVPSGTTKNLYRGHRMVILPDYQNLGIGSKVLDFFGEYYLKQGLRLCNRTSHIRVGNHMKLSPKWKATTTNGKISGHISYSRGKDANYTQQKIADRVCYSYEYVGEEYTKPKLQLYIDEYNGSIDTLKAILLKLKENYYIEMFHGIAGTEDELDKMFKELLINTSTLRIKRKGEINIKKTLMKKTIINTEEKLLDFLKDKI